MQFKLDNKKATDSHSLSPYHTEIKGVCWDGQYTKIKPMSCVLCLMSTLLIQEIKAHLASMVQIICYVNTVDTDTQCTAYMPLTPPRGKATCF